MNRQQLFEKALFGILRNPEVFSWNTVTGTCAYAGNNGNVCAIGHLISPEDRVRYDKAGGSTGISTIIQFNDFAEKYSGILEELSQVELEFIQDAHDQLATGVGDPNEIKDADELSSRLHAVSEKFRSTVQMINEFDFENEFTPLVFPEQEVDVIIKERIDSFSGTRTLR